ncbi:MAG: hypothetical protein AB7N76_04820 [Planctomycetota bacterium]
MSVTLAPRLICQGCQASLDLSGLRIGDSIRCSGCDRLEVITRQKVTQGDIPPAKRAGGLTPAERREVDDTLQRIKLRRVGQAARHVDLYPSWAILLAAGQFWLSALLAGQNLIAMGQATRGRRLQVAGGVAYVLLGLIYAGVALKLGATIPPALAVGLLVAPPIGFAAAAYWVQHAACRAARDAGAGQAPVLLPLLVGVIVAIAQAFAVWFIRHSLFRDIF